LTTQTRWWTFAVVSIALFMGMLDNLVVITALPAIRTALGATVSDLEWTVNAYTLTFAVLMMTGAVLGDRFGRKRVFLVGVTIFVLGSAAAALSDTGAHLAMARAVQGLGAAFLTPLTLTLLVRVFPPERRAAAIGLWSGISGLGLAIGPLVGGAIVSGITWNAIFWLNVPVGILVVALGWFRLEESFGDRKPLDLPGLALAGLGLFGVVYALVRGNSLGWTSPEIIASLALGAVMLVAFAAWERITKSPMLQLSLFKVREFSSANAVGFLMSAGMFGSIFLLTLFVQQIQGATPLQAGLKTMPWTGTIMIVAPIAGLISGRFGPRLIVIAGMLAQAAALFWLAISTGASTPYPQMLPAFILGGLGMGLTFAPLSAAVMTSVRERLQGEASGAYNSIRELGGVFGVAVLGAVFQHVATTPTSWVNGFHTALYVGAAIVALGAVAAAFLPASPALVAEESAKTVPVENAA
jgi:EmrB/QacA subfamily drug resistance transporter